MYYLVITICDGTRGSPSTVVMPHVYATKASAFAAGREALDNLGGTPPQTIGYILVPAPKGVS